MPGFQDEMLLKKEGAASKTQTKAVLSQEGRKEKFWSTQKAVATLCCCMTYFFSVLSPLCSPPPHLGSSGLGD